MWYPGNGSSGQQMERLGTWVQRLVYDHGHDGGRYARLAQAVIFGYQFGCFQKSNVRRMAYLLVVRCLSWHHPHSEGPREFVHEALCHCRAGLSGRL